MQSLTLAMVKEDAEFDKPYAGFKFEISEDSHDNLQTWSENFLLTRLNLRRNLNIVIRTVR